MTLLLPALFVALVVLAAGALLGHPGRTRPLARARIVASHTRRGLHAECPAQCGETHTERWPCAVAPRSSR